MADVKIERVEQAEDQWIVHARLTRPEIEKVNGASYQEHFELKLPGTASGREIEQAVKEEAKRRCQPAEDKGPRHKLDGKEIRL